MVDQKTYRTEGKGEGEKNTFGGSKNTLAEENIEGKKYCIDRWGMGMKREMQSDIWVWRETHWKGKSTSTSGLGRTTYVHRVAEELASFMVLANCLKTVHNSLHTLVKSLFD